jgi:hypothetical protein
VLHGLLIIIGIVLLARGAYWVLLIRRTASWEPIDVDIYEAHLVTELEPSLYVKVYNYFPSVNYTYRVHGYSMSSNCVSFDKKAVIFYDQNDAKNFLDKIISDSVAFVDPHNPEKSLLTRYVRKERKSHYRMLIVAGLLLVILGVLFLIF